MPRPKSYCIFLILVVPFATQLRGRLAEVLAAERGHVVDGEVIFVGQFGDRDVGHDDVSKELLFLLLDQPLAGRVAKCLLEVAVERGGRHVEFVHQLQGGLDVRIDLHHFRLEIVVVARKQGGEQCGQLLFVVEATQQNKQKVFLEALIMVARQPRRQCDASLVELAQQQVVNGQQCEFFPPP